LKLLWPNRVAADAVRKNNWHTVIAGGAKTQQIDREGQGIIKPEEGR
jgi:hypothetical protein